MNEHHMETRRRSRSKTPFLRSSCDHENCEFAGEDGHQHHHPKKKAAVTPNVQTIIEEPSNKEQYARTAISSQQSKSSSPSTSKTKQAELASKLTTTSSTTTVITKSRQLLGNFASSTPKTSQMHESYAAQFSTTGTDNVGRPVKEVTQNELNARYEKSQRENSGRKNNTNRSNKSNVQNGDINDHLAYKEYKLAGEYWNKTPKTDYTYSELSPHRRVLAPGVVAMPNMSRRSLDNHDDRVYHMIEKNPANEEYIRKRYTTTATTTTTHQQQQQQQKYIDNRRATERLLFDSGDELDTSRFEDYAKKRQQSLYANPYGGGVRKEQWWLMRLITTIVNSVTSTWSAITGGAVGGNESKLYHRTHYYEPNRGVLGSVKHGFVSLWRYAYIFISSILYLDTWLLQSNNAESRGRKRFFLLLLCLLPLLMLGAWYLLDDSDRQYYLQRSEELLPLSAVDILKSCFLRTGTLLQGFLLQVPLMLSRTKEKLTISPTRVPTHNMELKLQRSGLTAEEYENILNHINSYVQKLVDVKIQQQQEAQMFEGTKELTPEQTEVFVKVIRENLEGIAREKRATDNDDNGGKLKLSELSNEELDLLAQRVQLNLELNGWTSATSPVKLSSENLNEIKRLIAQQIEFNNHEHYTVLLEHIDLDDLLARLLRMPQLARFVDSRIDAAIFSGRLKAHEGSADGANTITNAAVEAQQRLIDDLNSEIAFIKLTLADKNVENADLHQSISRLKVNQDDLLERLQRHELGTDERFSGLLAEIQKKLNALHENQYTLLNKQIKLSLIEILGFKQTEAGTHLDDVDLKSWVRNMFVAKEYLEERLQAMNVKTNERIKDEIDRSGMILFRDISERLKQEILISVESKYNESSQSLKGEIRAALSEDEVRNIVKSVLAIYDADKTGLVDFALESAGGQIISTRCTESYQTKSAQISIFGIPLWYPTNTPRIAISPNVQPGECWAFQGFPGFLVLKLNSMVYVTGFTFEHIPRSLSPNGRIESAPRNFTVWGLEHEKDQDPVQFGEYEFLDNGASLQYFPVQNRNINRPYEVVELRIETNHGHPQYTCLYRFRVHGKPPTI